MALFLLIVFVGASLAFSLRAWMAYDEDPYGTSDIHSDDSTNKENVPLTTALIIVTFLGGISSELLRHSFKLSFIKAGAVSLGLLVIGQWLAVHFFARTTRGRDGQCARPSLPKPQS